LGVCSAASWLSLAESRLSIKVFAVLVTVFNVLFANFGETTVYYFILFLNSSNIPSSSTGNPASKTLGFSSQGRIIFNR
jgi:hypothetical protein